MLFSRRLRICNRLVRFMICRRAVDYSSVIVLVRTRIIETAEFVESSLSVRANPLHQSPKVVLLLEATMQKFRSFLSSYVFIVSTISSLSCAIPGIAQVDRSGLTGTVTDPSGRLLGQTHITVVENSTQSRREGLSDDDGRYDIAELPVGRYTVKFDHPGFQTLTFLDVEQVVGRTRTLDATLQISGGEEHVEVSAARS